MHHFILIIVVLIFAVSNQCRIKSLLISFVKTINASIINSNNSVNGRNIKVVVLVKSSQFDILVTEHLTTDIL